MRYISSILGVTCCLCIGLCLSNDVKATDSSISTATSAEVSFTVVDDMIYYPFNPDEEGYLDFPDDPGGVQNLTNADLKLLWASNFAFHTKDDIYDYQQENIGYSEKVEAYLKKDPKEPSNQMKKFPPLFQVWNSPNTGWDLKLSASDFYAEENLKDKENPIPMVIGINTITRGDTDQNPYVLPLDAKQINHVSESGIQLSESAQTLVSFNNESKMMGFSTYYFASEEESLSKEDHINSFYLTVPKGQDIQKNTTYIATLTWTLSAPLKK